MKKGDKVKIISGIYYPQNGEYYCSQNISIGEIYTLKEYLVNQANGIYWIFEECVGYEGKWAFEFQLELVNNLNKKPMNLKEKFLTSLKSEPEKSFRKAEITDGDDLLTEDGKAVFLSWLLRKNGAEFKKEVVDEILEEKKKEEKE